MPAPISSLLPFGSAGARRLVLAVLAYPAALAQAAVTVEVTDAAGKPVEGAVVFLESAEARKAVRPMPPQDIAQEKKQFLPGVLPVTLGTEVSFPNRDTVRHHVYSFSPAKKFELKLYTGRPATPVVFDQPGVVVLGCNIHDQMVGWVLVLETPYFAQTTAGGLASLPAVPPGSYRLRTWHARMAVGAPATDQPLGVAASGDARAAVRLTGLVP